MEQQVKKSIFKKWWFWVITVIVVFIIIGSSSSDKPQTETQNTTTETTTSTVGKQYQEIFKFSGNGQKKSEPFTITGSRFKIAYDCKGDPSATYCGAFVFKVGSVLPQGVMNSPKPIKDETIIYGSGEYYIDANTMGDFTMTVYDYK